jgi:flagellar biosynthetic protein FlhB
VSDDAQDKTEHASSQKLKKSKGEGQIARAKEFASACMLLGFCLYFYISFERIAEALLNLFKLNFSFSVETLQGNDQLLLRLSKSLFTLIEIFFPFLFVVVLSTLIGSLVLGGWVFSFKTIQPKLDKLSFFKGIKRMWSLKTFVELIKSILKVSVIIYLLYSFLSNNLVYMLSLQRLPIDASAIAVLTILAKYSLYIIAILLLYGLIDLPYQLYEFNKEMKMSKQELKDEHKQAEGRPEVKQRIRQIQQQMSQRAITKTVPDADVIIMNPSHYAVAVKYDPKRAEAPFLVAKGNDQTALFIQRIALENGVEVVISPALSRAIYHTTQLEQMIPNQLFVAIAHVLSYVMQLRRFKKNEIDKPNHLPNFVMPKGFQF